MYERSTGAYLLEVENLEKEVTRLQSELDALIEELEIVKSRLEREQEECDEQVRIVIEYARRYNRERDLADELAYILALNETGQARETVLRQWRTIRESK